MGMVGINVPIPVPMAFFSFGGWKQSLFGDSARPWQGRRQVLHAHEGGDEPLAARRRHRQQLHHADTRLVP